MSTKYQLLTTKLEDLWITTSLKNQQNQETKSFIVGILIIKIQLQERRFRRFAKVVEWQNAECAFLVNIGDDWQTMDDCPYEVVGNIYDNKEEE